MLCESENKVEYNCFISYSSKDGNQEDVFHKICNDISKDITILDVDIKDTGINENMRNSVLSNISKCQLFICILTPTYTDIPEISSEFKFGNVNIFIESQNGKYEFNSNVMLELGYAMSCVQEEYIHCFIELGTEKEFMKIRPSLLDDIKYEIYSCGKCITEFIEKKFDDYNKNHDHDCYNGLNKYILQDKTCNSLINLEYLKELDNSNSGEVKEIMEKYLFNYDCYETKEMTIMYIREHIGLLDTNVNDCFFYVVHHHILYSDWMSKKNNQVTITNIFNHLKYLLFHKYANENTEGAIHNRMHFALLLIELLNNYHISVNLKKCVQTIINESITECNMNCKDNNYTLYIELLRCELKSRKGKDEDLILNDFYQKSILESETGYNKFYY